MIILLCDYVIRLDHPVSAQGTTITTNSERDWVHNLDTHSSSWIYKAWNAICSKNLFLLSRIIILTIAPFEKWWLRAIAPYNMLIGLDLMTWQRPVSFHILLTIENVLITTNVNLLQVCIRIYRSMYFVYACILFCIFLKKFFFK